MTMDAAMGFPASTARSVAGTSNTFHASRSSSPSKSEEFTTTIDPGLSLADTGGQYL